MSADRWTTCRRGHVHWGAAGAAGALLFYRDPDGTPRYLLQQRAPWVDHGGTYSTPGGALAPGETPEQAARREVWEELGAAPDFLVAGTYRDDHGGWAYWTVLGEVDRPFAPGQMAEGVGTVWVTRAEAEALPLHPGLRATWGHVIAPDRAGPTSRWKGTPTGSVLDEARLRGRGGRL
jgi:8-oxo-dGTP pyrophosphatase MutT (NUDIX family)